jgi:protein ImuB
VFGAIYAAEGTLPGSLADVAREFSPRIEASAGQDRDREIVLDLNGLTRLFGDARTIAEELRRTAADRGLRIRVAIAGSRTAARLLVRHRAGLTVIEPGTEAAALAPLPIALLTAITIDRNGSNAPNGSNDPNDFVKTFRRWGLRTLGDLAALPPDDVAARLGQPGVQWQRLAVGDDPAPLVPALPEERFEQALDLEWPIEDLEPLAFVLGRLLEPLETHLERRGRGAAVLHVRLHLVKTEGRTGEIHERTLQLPTPIRDARTLRTLALLDLESNPPAAPIDRVVVAVDPTPERIVQFSLLTRPLPSPEQLSTLMARLHALMGETRCGAPALVDSWKPGVFGMKPFAPHEANAIHRRNDTSRHRGTEANTSKALIPSLSVSVPRCAEEKKDLGASMPRCVVKEKNLDASAPALALRRFRHPVPARVRVEDGRPVRVSIDRRGMNGGGVDMCAGPWRTSGGWWETGTRDSGLGTRESGTSSDPGSRIPNPEPWDHDEWDVTLTDGATYRLFRARDTDRWFVEGVVD